MEMGRRKRRQASLFVATEKRSARSATRLPQAERTLGGSRVRSLDRGSLQAVLRIGGEAGPFVAAAGHLLPAHARHERGRSGGGRDRSAWPRPLTARGMCPRKRRFMEPRGVRWRTVRPQHQWAKGEVPYSGPERSGARKHAVASGRGVQAKET